MMQGGAQATLPSKKAIDRAGTLLRDFASGDLSGATLSELQEAARTLFDYRDSFSYPLRKVTVGVRQFVKAESASVVVSQRLKRMPTILDKLSRHPTMKITRMQDVGGCRAILEGGAAEVQGVLGRIRRNWEVRKVYDYCEEPKPRTGYRAVHVVIERDARLLEIQLRTPNQHQWAVEIETASARLAMPRLKDGEGPDDLVRYFELAGHLLAVADGNEDADRASMREFRSLRTTVRPYFARLDRNR